MSPYKHLSIIERESILIYLSTGKSIREMAVIMKRSPSTISRELERNKNRKTAYSPCEAQKRYVVRRANSGKKCILDNPTIKAKVQDLFLNRQWSPEQISQRLRAENNAIRISFPTIYRGIYSGKLEVKPLSNGERGVARKLRHRGKARHKKGTVETRGKITISNHIDERPEEALTRQCIGHWEADTVIGKASESCLITITDRCSRFLLSAKVSRKASNAVSEKMIQLLSTLPTDYLKSITPDRGKEFAKHSAVTSALNGIQFYFPQPHAPWQRGTNENTNGLIREYVPKGFQINSLSDGDINDFVYKLNTRPRKCLSWKSPFEVFYNTVLHLT